MVKIYTRKGDDGTTSLWYGGRISKSHLRTGAYGTLDEAVSQLGVARAAAAGNQRVTESILRLQRELFVAGAELATAPEAKGRLEPGVSRVTESMVEQLETEIDAYMAEVELPAKFVLPGGTPLSAALDVARAVLRRAERCAVAVAAKEEISAELLSYLNRAADLVYAIARFTDVDSPELFEGRN